jgi:mannose-6-phosphate isomerase-like protein (cupin superfamily)
MEHFVRVTDHAEAHREKPFKHTFFNSARLLVGVNVLTPGQSQPVHDHADQDKYYLVLEGSGRFTVGEASQECGPGTLVLAPAGVMHGVTNDGGQRLVFLTTIAPGMG